MLANRDQQGGLVAANTSNELVIASPIAPGTMYKCGDCGYKFDLKKGDVVMCRKCQFRIVYKVRTNRMVQFEAR